MTTLDPADQRTLEELLRRHGARPQRRLGQNFLVDPSLCDEVATAAGVVAGDRVLEVGSGPGTLSVRLAAAGVDLTCVEIDRRLVHAWREVMSGRPATVLEGDVLRLPLPSADVVAGNIPYYLTGALLPRLLEPEPRPRTVSLVVQKEVAERWTSPGDWSLGSLAVQVFAAPELVRVIPAAAFWPPPEVDSALVVLRVRDRPAVAVADLGAFFRLAERVFQFRRKQLAASLGRLGAADAAARLRAVGIEPERRPQTLSLAEWERLHAEFAND